MNDKKIYDAIVKSEPILKGWSEDKKYCVTTTDGQRLLLRVSDISEYERKKAEFSMMERAYNHGVCTSRPIEFGLCDGDKSVYQLSEWLDGEDGEVAHSKMSDKEKYNLGVKAGELLRKIHTLPVPDDAEPWNEWFIRKKVQPRMDFYNTNPDIQSENSYIIVQYLQNNKHLLNGRPQTFCHGDFNKSNLMIMQNGQIAVIDFNNYNKDHGDPWWEFDFVNWGGEPNPYYCTGLIKGYFGGEPPHKFFEIISYYIAYDAIGALCDTSLGNQGEPEEGWLHVKNSLLWLDNFKKSTPKWYLRDFHSCVPDTTSCY